MLTKLRLLLVCVITASGLFAFMPHASADVLCANVAVRPLLSSPTICLPVP